MKAIIHIINDIQVAIGAIFMKANNMTTITAASKMLLNIHQYKNLLLFKPGHNVYTADCRHKTTQKTDEEIKDQKPSIDIITTMAQYHPACPSIT